MKKKMRNLHFDGRYLCYNRIYLVVGVFPLSPRTRFYHWKSQSVNSFPCAFTVSCHVYGMCRSAFKDNMSSKSKPGYIERVMK